MDRLCEIIHEAAWNSDAEPRRSPEDCIEIANAVRSYLESDEVVDRGHVALHGAVSENELMEAVKAMAGTR